MSGSDFRLWASITSLDRQPLFIHLVRPDQVRVVKRRGIKACDDGLRLVPIRSSHADTHSWLPELQRWGDAPVAIAQVLLSPMQQVSFTQSHRPMRTTDAASAWTTFHFIDRQAEIRLHRSVGPEEIVQVRPLLGADGWRRFASKPELLPCSCPACVYRDAPGARAQRLALERARQRPEDQ